MHSSGWKAYLWSLQNVINDDAAGDEADNHNEVAMEHLKRCDMLLEDCNMILSALEETLAKTPKPSEVLDWQYPVNG